MLKKARIVSMIVLAASVVVTAGLAVENLVLACLALGRKRCHQHTDHNIHVYIHQRTEHSCKPVNTNQYRNALQRKSQRRRKERIHDYRTARHGNRSHTHQAG